MDKKRKAKNEKKDQRSGTTSHFELKAAGERRCDDGRIILAGHWARSTKAAGLVTFDARLLFVEEAPGWWWWASRRFGT